ncbi:TIR domain-containing protein [Chloroflexota bacterium]
MPTNVFISFERHNLQQVNSIRALANNPQHELEFHDRSELKPVRDRAGTPLPYQPDDPTRSNPIKKELRRLLKKATKMVVVIGEFTHASNWVNWEFQSFYDRYNRISGDSNQRVVAMYIRDRNDIELPKIFRTHSIPHMNWDLDALSQWINTNPNQPLQALPLLDL